MIRRFVRDVLVGLIFLALLGFVEVMIGPELTMILGGAAVIGALINMGRRTVIDHAIERGSTLPRPIGRASRPPLSFPDRPIVPTRDAHFGE